MSRRRRPNFVQNLEPITEEVVADSDVTLVLDPPDRLDEQIKPRPNEYRLVKVNGVLTPMPLQDSDWMREFELRQREQAQPRGWGTRGGGHIFFDTGFSAQEMAHLRELYPHLFGKRRGRDA